MFSRVKKLKLTVLFMLSLLVFTSEIQAQRGSLMIQAERMSGDTFPVYARTPRGANIYAVNKVSPAMMAEIDRGLNKLFGLARKNGYDRFLNYSDYTIFIAKPDRLKSADGDYSPDLAIPAAQYAGTDFDQGGYIYAAGLVLGYRPAGFLIAEHKKSLSRVAEVVSYEGEHIILYHNDRQRYLDTMDHSRGGTHPILQ